MVNATTGYDAKVQKYLEECKVSDKLIKYMENFDYPYVNDVQIYYEQLLKIGQGTFGEVFKARCKRTGQLVALKKILMENEKEGFPITALREIKMLKLLRHPNITELIEVCTRKQRNARERFSFYLVFTFCEHDLAGLLSNKTVKFSLVDIKTMAKHILEGLNKIHKSNILHRDMKSANVLITSDGVLKLADFGLARLMIKQKENRYTNRVVTLWYRPPELLLGSSHYGPTIDIWGAGCIISELWIRSPILQGNTEQQQLDLIAKLCGSINPQVWPGCEQLPLYGKMPMHETYHRRLRDKIFPMLQQWADGLDLSEEQFVHFLAFTTQQNEQALALIDQMLSLCPAQRPSAETALDHNFFWQPPLPANNIKELVDKLKGQNLFEYTSGCGAHANRKQQRPVAPAAPVHSGSSNNQLPPHRKPTHQPQMLPQAMQNHQQQIRPTGGGQQHFITANQRPTTSSNSGQMQPFNAMKPGRAGMAPQQQYQQRMNKPNNITPGNAQQQYNRKRPIQSSSDDFNLQPPMRLQRPTPLVQTSAGRPTQQHQSVVDDGGGGVWMQQRVSDGGGIRFGSPPIPTWQHQQSAVQHFNQQQNQQANPRPSPQPLLSTQRQNPWQSQQQQQQYMAGGMSRMPLVPPQQLTNPRYTLINSHQPNYTRQPPPTEQSQHRFFNNR